MQKRCKNEPKPNQNEAKNEAKTKHKLTNTEIKTNQNEPKMKRNRTNTEQKNEPKTTKRLRPLPVSKVWRTDHCHTRQRTLWRIIP